MSYIFDINTLLSYTSGQFLLHIWVGDLNKVREYRQALGLSQKDLAIKVEVSRQTINLIENNKYNPTIQLCLKICCALDADLNTLFWEDNDA